MAGPVKDVEHEGPVPQEWRATLAAIVASLVRGDDVLAGAWMGSIRLRRTFRVHVSMLIDAYGGVTLVPVPEETRQTSVALWQGDHLSCLVDLWTAEEGRSDLVLDAHVFEDGDASEFTWSTSPDPPSARAPAVALAADRSDCHRQPLPTASSSNVRGDRPHLCARQGPLRARRFGPPGRGRRAPRRSRPW